MWLDLCVCIRVFASVCLQCVCVVVVVGLLIIVVAVVFGICVLFVVDNGCGRYCCHCCRSSCLLLSVYYSFCSFCVCLVVAFVSLCVLIIIAVSVDQFWFKVLPLKS